MSDAKKLLAETLQAPELDLARRAVLIFTSRMPGENIEPQIESIFGKLMSSENSELLVEIAEACMIGIQLPKDNFKARALLNKAYQLDKLKGAYGLGRYFYALDDLNGARKYFKIAATYGHLVSKAILKLQFGIGQRIKIVGKILFLPNLFINWSKLSPLELRDRLWRQTDEVSLRRGTENFIGRDRNVYLPFTVPLSLISLRKAVSMSPDELKRPSQTTS